MAHLVGRLPMGPTPQHLLKQPCPSLLSPTFPLASLITRRRPAVFPVAILMSLVFATQILGESLTYNHSHLPIACSLWMSWCFLLYLAFPWVIYRALVLDSLWWQGLYVGSKKKYNLNEPLLDVWGALRAAPASTLAVCMTDLEDDVVPIIPFGQICLRTDQYFPGG